MKPQEYSIVIRTLGNAGNKYKALLESISAQTLLPKEVIVVIPHGYDLPVERLGFETFVRSDKGMVIQRCAGLEAMTTELGLFLDDDLSFDNNFAQTLIGKIDEYRADVIFPILQDLLPQSFKQKLLSMLMLSAIPFHSQKWFTKIYRNGSYGYCAGKLTEDVYSAMTAPGACFLARKANFKSISFKDERWLELTQYARPEDQVMFYKFYLTNNVVKGVTTCSYIHLDAGGQTKDRAKIAAYSMAKNKFIFWHRYIYKINDSKISRFVSLLCYAFTALLNILFLLVSSLFGRDCYQKFIETVKGMIDGYKFLKSSEYRSIPAVIK